MNHTILEIFLYGCSSSPNGNQTRASILGGLRLIRSTMGLSYYPFCFYFFFASHILKAPPRIIGKTINPKTNSKISTIILVLKLSNGFIGTYPTENNPANTQ